MLKYNIVVEKKYLIVLI